LIVTDAVIEVGQDSANDKLHVTRSGDRYEQNLSSSYSASGKGEDNGEDGTILNITDSVYMLAHQEAAGCICTSQNVNLPHIEENNLMHIDHIANCSRPEHFSNEQNKFDDMDVYDKDALEDSLDSDTDFIATDVGMPNSYSLTSSSQEDCADGDKAQIEQLPRAVFASGQRTKGSSATSAISQNLSSSSATNSLAECANESTLMNARDSSFISPASESRIKNSSAQSGSSSGVKPLGSGSRATNSSTQSGPSSGMKSQGCVSLATNSSTPSGPSSGMKSQGSVSRVTNSSTPSGLSSGVKPLGSGSRATNSSTQSGPSSGMKSQGSVSLATNSSTPSGPSSGMKPRCSESRVTNFVAPTTSLSGMNTQDSRSRSTNLAAPTDSSVAIRPPGSKLPSRNSASPLATGTVVLSDSEGEWLFRSVSDLFSKRRMQTCYHIYGGQS